MSIRKVSSREFNQHTYQRLVGAKGSLIDALGQPPGVEDVKLEIPPLRDPARPADLR